MFSVTIQNWLPLVLVMSLVSVQSEHYHSYSWRGYKVRKWHDFTPLVTFHSRRIHPPSTTTTSSEDDYPAVPLGPLPPVDYDYPEDPMDHEPEVKDKDKDTSEKDVKKKDGENFNITIERFGGFGGTGDLRGYGAYEAYDYKKNDEHLPDAPFPDILRVPKVRGPILNSILNVRPLPPA